jgi:hypothetical protein
MKHSDFAYKLDLHSDDCRGYLSELHDFSKIHALR